MNRPSTTDRAEVLYKEHAQSIARRTDRLFALLLASEWIASIAVAALLSPLAWEGPKSHIHPHVWAACFLGGGIAVGPTLLGLLRPARTSTRHTIAIAQMLTVALLIHLTGGRIETHFSIFGSLAFLAFYRDWRVIVTASLVVAVDHIVRGAWWPESVYGVLSNQSWRWVEHAWWVVFEDVFLIIACVRGDREMRRIADRHAQLEAQNEIERSYAAANAANQAKSEFLANMSHEIRTPMTAIQGYADLLLDDKIDSSDRLNYVQTIRRNSDHLLSIINDILDISKIEAGKMMVETIACEPAQIVVEVASLMRVRATEKNLGFHVEFQTPVPKRIHSDPTRLRQILINLVGNAIKFTESGSVRILVRCLEPEGEHPLLAFEVADSGIGLTKAQEARLFQPFGQADTSTTRKFGGTGLGLVICQRLAGILGGAISVESLPDRGSSFTLTIATGALDGVEMAAELREAGPSPALSPAASTAKLDGSVLLAEDGVDNQLLIATHLRKAGLKVTIANNGRIAVELALATGASFDVILMDMQMPELDGYGATAKLRARGYVGPIIALTAHAMAGDRERCLKAGCDDYLTKPIDRRRLLATVQQHLRADAGSAAPSVATLRSLYADDPDMTELVATFVRNLGERCEEMTAAFSAGDLTKLRAAAHQLKGAGGSFGFPNITTTAAALEATLNLSTDATAIRAALDPLLELCRQAGAAALQAASAARRSA